MGELGNTLRQAREARGLSLAQVEEQIRVRSAYLSALEEEDFAQLPGPVYVKGFLKNYAQFLGLDAAQILSLYQPPAADATAATTAMLNEPLQGANLRRYWPVGIVLLAISLIFAAAWAHQRYDVLALFTRFTATPTPTATPTATPAPPTPTSLPPTATLTPSPTAGASPTPAPAVAGLELEIDITGERSWLLVEVDGERVFAGILEPGAKQTWRAEERIYLRSGNAGAVRLTMNGESLGLFGERGQVLEQEWTAAGVPTSTPAPTPSP